MVPVLPDAPDTAMRAGDVGIACDPRFQDLSEGDGALSESRGGEKPPRGQYCSVSTYALSSSS
ncbi:hypothetical protein Plo01_22990 [Planobispora longispora]|uniref:Uncharacterized protein n=1 Tax=Planobispora longispora TaxID=28887 RepID=A0A8J3RJ83_9ACTN|nr:hypothetical protein Plo01_22990 [Planobispora longispora]